MQIKSMYAKDIARSIDGVIKASDHSHIALEVDEYVLTNEASKGLEQLLDAYNASSNPANGAWISGFFGSGKSHMLKMLAHLLGEVAGSGVERAQVVAAFTEKAGTNAMLSAAIQKAGVVPARSLLFNIDEKAAVVAKDQTDALMKVFVRVFDDACGYYGAQGHIAQLERDLDGKGHLADFKQAYEDISGTPWEQGRAIAILEEPNIAAAYARVLARTKGAPEDIIARYSNEYKVSIDGFAKNVREWLDKQEPGSRLNFYVDEVGQFIAGNVKLMLNLQTIAESLAVTCKGRAWVMVTSQEDMEQVLGDRTKSQANDFSKIQARFSNRVKLTSADVEEVIQKRLLTKNPDGTKALAGLYAAQSGNFQTLFTFSDGGRTYLNFDDAAHFTASYPFVPYQFPLFRSAFTGISDHNGFEGRHVAVGERSMLGVFQQVARDLDGEVGQLATLDAMFEGIRSALKAAAQSLILTAEGNLAPTNPFAVRVLKALFLMKYVPSFKATARNLTVLVYDRFDTDLTGLTAQVQEALNVLEQQTYIQRNGNLYEYLTNDEKDIEQEIKAVDVDASTVTSQISKMITGDVLKTTKLSYAKTGQDFPFCLKVDDVLTGKVQELAINVITSQHDNSADIPALRAHTVGTAELRVVLPDDARLIADVVSFLRTDRYVRVGANGSLSDSHRRILQSKSEQNSERYREIVERLRQLIGAATLMVAGADLAIGAKDPLQRVEQGFQELITRTYPSLSLLGSKNYSEADIANAVSTSDATLDDDSVTPLTQAETEVLNHIKLKEQGGERLTVATIVKAFEVKPYGWSLAATLTQIARMTVLGRVTLSVDAKRLARTEITNSLRNTARHASIIVSVQQQYTAAQTKAVRDLYKDFFDTGQVPNDAIEAAKACGDGFAKLANELDPKLQLASRYPFVYALDPIIKNLRAYATQTDQWRIEQLPGHSQELLEAKTKVIQPIVTFFAGPQLGIYDAAATLLNTVTGTPGLANSEAAAAIHSLLMDPDVLTGGKIAQLKTMTETLRKDLDALLTTARATATTSVDERAGQLRARPEWSGASDAVRSQVEEAISAQHAAIAAARAVGSVQETVENFGNAIYPRLVDAVLAPIKVSAREKNSAEPPTVPAAPVSVALKSLDISFTNVIIATEADAEAYLSALRTRLLQVLSEGRRVTL